MQRKKKKTISGLEARQRKRARAGRLNDSAAEERIEVAMQKMATEGLPRLATKRGPMPPFKPIRIKGASITKTISEERDEK